MDDFPQRRQLVEYIRSVLIGPQAGPAEVIEGTPFLRYMTGMIFPIGESADNGGRDVTATADEDIRDAESDRSERQEPTASIELAFESLPSAVGLSFKVRNDARVDCSTWAARYVPQASGANDKANPKKPGRASKRWAREVLASEERPAKVTFTRNSKPVEVFGGLARLVPQWRELIDGTAIVTITLVNTQEAGARLGLDPAKALFQVGIRCAGEILPYPEITVNHGDETEESEVAFLYRGAKPFARGHGCAAKWDEAHGPSARWVSTDFIPSVDVPYPTFELPVGAVDRNVFDLAFLDEAPRGKVLEALRGLASAYGKWVKAKELATVPAQFQGVAAKFTERAKGFHGRMVKGIDLLERSNEAWQAFRLANRAMGMQMLLSKNLKSGPFAIGAKRSPPSLNLKGLTWRPFQVAFLVGVLESLANPESKDRDLVDVIWFPTGGGKTEAYLFLTAFELVRRRLVHGSTDTATAVLSRYTLRLLTAQQFQRTSALIVALEVLRRANPTLLGNRSFSLGLWVGQGSTPNRYRLAHELFNSQLESKHPKNPFILTACPCCGTAIFPEKPTRQGRGWRRSEFGVSSSEAKFAFYCPNVDCEFHAGLPLNVVDDALYEDPPSMLLGTIDKFAQLPWDDRSRVFFGGADDKAVPPSLVIQDELHLISGPLGSLAAPYELAIDAIIQLRATSAKRIGSTATIRNAIEQVRGLYGRQAAVFPSPCGSWDDAFFFRTDTNRPGRQYVGIMGQGYIKPVVAMAWATAALMQSVKEVPLDPETLDAYWTLLAYHNSRRELGRTLTAARDEVATRIKAIASTQSKVRTIGEPLELSAQMVKSMTEALGELERHHSPTASGVDLVPCTSIISVGVDIDRLGVMLVNGQPKLTSEYIQATSRVGRSAVPGLVVTLFSASKPRDRSHYEDFHAYHEAIYRYVEPTSVTPFALPARERTLHAALVAVVRHALQWRKFDEAGNVDFQSPNTLSAVQTLLELMKASDPAEASSIEALLQHRIQQWLDFAEASTPLLYENRQAGAQFAALLHQYGGAKAGSLWPTMTSVRNVDEETPIAVK